MGKEPARIISLVTAFATAAIAFAVAFGLNLSDDQRNAILGMIPPTAAMFVIAGECIRSRVVSPETAASAVAQAKREDPSTPAVPEIEVKGFRGMVANNLQVRAGHLTFRSGEAMQPEPGVELSGATT
ncbi:MAG: hypothetical protein IT336_03435 [Thermomicrobiales bacterium]|nr:hypothetical protein [Thermomicrobiales bacterium]